MFARALLPVDFSEINEALLAELKELRLMGVEEIILAHVVEKLPYLFVDEDKKRMIYESLEEKTLEKLEEYRSFLQETGFKAIAYTPIPVGDVAEEILKIEDRVKPDLIVLTSKGKNWFKTSLTGSTSETILKKSSSPVLYVKILVAGEGGKYSFRLKGLLHKILVATDLSREAEKLYECAAYLARQASSKLYLLHVIEYYRAPDSIIRLAREELEGDAQRLEEQGLRVRYSLRRGVPHKEIIDYAIEHDASLILLGMRGEESFLKGLLMGSTADAVIRHSPVPILVCK